jgi:aldose 1-epimerase
LHGGSKGWGKQTWEGPKPVNRNGREEVMFKYHSPDGDAGFPGAVEARVFYSVEKVKNDGVQLDWEYEVELVGDEVEETVINVTNHGYVGTLLGTSIQGLTHGQQFLEPLQHPNN